MLQKPTLRPDWRAVLSVDAVAHLIQDRHNVVERALRTAEGRERVRQRLAQTLDVPANRLDIGQGPTGAVKAGDVWLEVPVVGGWVAASRLAIQEGRLVIAEVRVFPGEDTALRRGSPPKELLHMAGPGRWSGEVLGVQAEVPPGGLTASTLRTVRLGEHPRHVRAVVQWLAKQYGADAFKSGGSLAALGLAPEGERPRPARQFGRGDLFYARLARDYGRLIERGSEQPVAAIATARGVAVARIRGWLHEARVRGLLTPGVQGRSGGQLTARAERLLRDADRTESGRKKVKRERPRKALTKKQRNATAKPKRRAR